MVLLCMFASNGGVENVIKGCAFQSVCICVYVSECFFFSPPDKHIKTLTSHNGGTNKTQTIRLQADSLADCMHKYRLLTFNSRNFNRYVNSSFTPIIDRLCERLFEITIHNISKTRAHRLTFFGESDFLFVFSSFSFSLSLPLFNRTFFATIA